MVLLVTPFIIGLFFLPYSVNIKLKKGVKISLLILNFTYGIIYFLQKGLQYFSPLWSGNNPEIYRRY
ncbi:hypothetical protein DDT54_06970 [Brenneria nigrifluens DSM 30175 = ATCC 13028]|uniref:Uncharacterized protein n=1 Tax=Brenneria nigrifluens DSM 30175 = ATCC 13028 TaxID=1121120 RepID=A0A2U1UTM2_9GAMM|nr:hypothetical protein DDT54_06970 [Brenneria nigrifluens DSM 30175 = ATCC 13028]